jgi:hypothetical protein
MTPPQPRERFVNMAVFATLLVLSQPVPSAAASYMVLGFGNKSCGTWTQEHQAAAAATAAATQPASSIEQVNSWTFSRATQLMNEGWVQGYITAYNATVLKSGQLTGGTDNEGLWAWIDGYCATHPLDDLSTATYALVEELLKRPKVKQDASPN